MAKVGGPRKLSMKGYCTLGIRAVAGITGYRLLKVLHISRVRFRIFNGIINYDT